MPACHRALSGDDPVTVRMAFLHSEISAAMLDEHVVFFKRTFIEEEGQPFTGCEFALGMLGLNAFLASAQPGAIPAFHKFSDFVFLYAHVKREFY